MLIVERLDSASETARAAAVVVSNQGWARAAVPGVVGPSDAADRLAARALSEPVEDLAHIPVGAVVLAIFSNNERMLISNGVQGRLPAAPVVASVEVVEVSACTEVALGVIGQVLEPLGEVV